VVVAFAAGLASCKEPKPPQVIEVAVVEQSPRATFMTLRVLMLEDRDTDAELAAEHLRIAGFQPLVRRVYTRGDFEREVGEFGPDVIVCDHGLPGFDALGALRTAKSLRPWVPFVVLTGEITVGELVSSVRGGADDVVLKSDLARFPATVRRALDLRATLRLLTPRQLEVFRMIVEGRTTREVADRLGLSLKTVESHRLALMKRLDLHDVVGLVRYAVKVRLIAPDP
jgi:DNA-binding NarL/FixJ family response regulator